MFLLGVLKFLNWGSVLGSCFWGYLDYWGNAMVFFLTPENFCFRDCPSQLGWDACMQCHAMHRTYTTLVGSECTYVHRVGKVTSPMF